jgi:hypothetical protein
MTQSHRTSKPTFSDSGSTRGPSVVMFSLRVRPATAMSSLARRTPRTPGSIGVRGGGRGDEWVWVRDWWVLRCWERAGGSVSNIQCCMTLPPKSHPTPLINHHHHPHPCRPPSGRRTGRPPRPWPASCARRCPAGTWRAWGGGWTVNGGRGGWVGGGGTLKWGLGGGDVERTASKLYSWFCCHCCCLSLQLQLLSIRCHVSPKTEGPKPTSPRWPCWRAGRRRRWSGRCSWARAWSGRCRGTWRGLRDGGGLHARMIN